MQQKQLKNYIEEYVKLGGGCHSLKYIIQRLRESEVISE